MGAVEIEEEQRQSRPLWLELTLHGLELVGQVWAGDR